MVRNHQEAAMSFVTNYSRVERDLSMEELYQTIKGPSYKDKVDTIKKLYLESNNVAAKRLKMSLPGITISGTFNKHRSGKNLSTYSGYLCLDVDDVDPHELIRLKASVQEVPYTVMAFTSPSGFGLKVIVRVDSGSEYHKDAYRQVQTYYEKELDRKCDKSTVDVARMCYISHDPNVYFNPEAEFFTVTREHQVQLQDSASSAPSTDTVGHNYIAVFNKVVSFTNNKEQFKEGSRNRYLHLLSCNCNRFGLQRQMVLELIIDKYKREDFGIDEITKTVNRAYNSNKGEFGEWRMRPQLTTPTAPPTQTVPVMNEKTALIGDAVDDMLLGLLKNVLSNILDKKKTDVDLTVNLITLYSVLPKHLAPLCLQYIELLYNNMKENKETLPQGGNLRKLYEILPDQFDRKAAIELARKNNIHISNRTVDNYLKRLHRDGLLEHSYNNYSRKQRAIDTSGSNKAAA